MRRSKGSEVRAGERSYRAVSDAQTTGEARGRPLNLTQGKSLPPAGCRFSARRRRAAVKAKEELQAAGSQNFLRSQTGGEVARQGDELKVEQGWGKVA